MHPLTSKIQAAGSLSALTIALLALTFSGCATAQAQSPLKIATDGNTRVKIDVQGSHPLIKSDSKETVYMKVGLTGVPLPSESRTPVNVAIVLDKSGSMQGRKIQQAKAAALQAIDMLNPDDIVSVVTYDSTVRVIVPATKVSERATIQAGIRAISAGGNTALFAGVSKGAQEVRKFHDRNKVNRIILLSDGMANVGPSSPGELGELGASLAKEGISVTTFGLGLGYNEDLMFSLARNSDGNHTFIEDAANLATIFQAELGDVLSVVAQDVQVEITCAEGVRPVRLLGRDGDITGQQVTVGLSQLYGRQEKYALLEVEVSPRKVGAKEKLADVRVTYADMVSKNTAEGRGQLSANFVDSRQEVEQASNRDVMVAVVQLIANERNQEAMALRDAGKVEQARKALKDTSTYLQFNATKYKAPSLKKQKQEYDFDADNLDGANWNKQRKSMRKRQFQLDTQQSY
ncbi:MAG: vWA domain-containing protein [Bradymonadia bacterium]